MAEDVFVRHRRLLFTVAYDMLGSTVDAEDVLQESWLKWSRVAQTEVRDPRAYLVRIVTRASLDPLRTVARRCEEYVGPWSDVNGVRKSTLMPASRCTLGASSTRKVFLAACSIHTCMHVPPF